MTGSSTISGSRFLRRLLFVRDLADEASAFSLCRDPAAFGADFESRARRPEAALFPCLLADLEG